MSQNSENHLNGFLILDKPPGITSHDCCQKVKEILKAKKAGHAGTLDINVTGVLIIAINEACKLMPLLSRLDKTYEGKAKLHKEVSLKKLKKAVKKFSGVIKQIPPRRSRVLRVERERRIYEFEILEKRKKDFIFLVKCEAGTYIRKLIHDLGKELGGAHLTALRRTQQGPYKITEAITLEQVEQKKENSLIEMEKMIERLNLPKIIVDKKSFEKLKQGKFLKAKEFKKQGVFEKEQILPCFYNKKIVALVKPFFSSQEIEKQKDYVLKPERIIKI
ncbi:MAG: hypothetical protein QXQ82_03080 [Candidatus Pacearchaeota archaeon]